MGSELAAKNVSRRKFLKYIGAGAVVVAGAAAGAYYTTQPTPKPTTTSSLTATSPVSTTVTPKGRIALNLATSESLRTVDPAVCYGSGEVPLALNVYDTLFFPDFDKTGAEVPVPRLATDWTISPDKKVYTIQLRKGVKFHNGKELTADDVAFSIDRNLAIKQAFTWLWLGMVDIGSTKAKDRYTVEFNLKNPFSPFMASLVRLYVVNKDLLMENKRSGNYGEFGDYGQGWLNEGNDAGSGAYRLVKWERRVQAIMQRFDDHYRGWKEPNHVDDFIIREILEPATLKTMMMKGEIDMDDGWYGKAFYKEVEGMSGVVVEKKTWTQLQIISFNNKRTPTDDVNVRRAISWAFDYQVPVTALDPGSIQARGIIPKGSPGYDPTVFTYKQDLQKAKEELGKSKYSMAELGKMTLEYRCRPLETNIAPGLLLKDNLEKIGLRVEVIPTDWVKIVESCAKPETTPHHLPWWNTIKTPDPDSFLSGWLTPASHGTFQGMCWYDNPKVTQLVEDSKTEIDPEKRNAVVRKIQDQVIDDAVAILVANPNFAMTRNVRVQGWTYHNCNGHYLEVYPITIPK